MNSILIISFGLLVSLNCWVKSEEFCQAFRENNDRISYTYKFDSPNDFDVFIDLIINGKQWRLETNKKIKDIKFQDPKNEIKPILPFFSGNHSLALRSCKKSWKDCSVLLINTNTWMASIGMFSTGPASTGDLKPENLKQKKVLKMNGIKGKPFAAFQTDYEIYYSYNKDKRVFVEYNRTTGQLDATGYDLFATDGTEIDAVEVKLDDWLNNNKVIFVKTNIGQLNLLSLISLYKEPDKNNWGYLLLFEKDLQIRWCWTHAEQNLSNECKPGNLLIDCSSVPLPVTISKTTTTTTTITPKTTTTKITLSPTTISQITTSQTTASQTTTSPTATLETTTSTMINEPEISEWVIIVVIVVCISVNILLIIGIVSYYLSKKPVLRAGSSIVTANASPSKANRSVAPKA